MKELTFICSTVFMKFRLYNNNMLMASSSKMGLNTWIPYNIMNKGIAKLKEITTDENRLKEIEKKELELKKEENFLKTNSHEVIITELKRQMAIKGFKLIKLEEKEDADI